MNRAWIAPLALLVLVGCGRGGESHDVRNSTSSLLEDGTAVHANAGPVCDIVETSVFLPDQVRESSGLALSRVREGVLWTHNDAGNGSRIMALNPDGELLQTVSVAQAEAHDWEDIAASSCEAGDCLYIGDIGDNDAERETITIYRIPEPAGGATRSEPATALSARFPDGAKDAEGLIVLDSGEMYIVTKGRRGPIALYRYPPPQRPEATVTLEHVRDLFPEPEDAGDRVTAASISPDGRWVAIRSYRELFLYPSSLLSDAQAVEPTVVDLEPLGQSQGESVEISPDGTIWLSTEAESNGKRPSWARLRCGF